MAATKVTRNLDEIDARVKSLGDSLNAAKERAEKLDRGLELRPNSVVLSAQKVKALGDALSAAKDKVQALKDRQDAMDKAMKAGLIVDENEYKKLQDQIKKATGEVRKLENQAAKADKVSMTNLQSGLRSVARFAKMALAAIGGLIVGAAELGSTIHDNSQQIGVDYKTYQLLANQYEQLTGDASQYVKAMTSINSMMGQIAKGNTAKAEKALSAVGMTLNDIAGMSMAEVYDAVIERLSAIDDETERTAAAIAMFGDAGSSVAIVAGTASDELERMNEQYSLTSLLSDETIDKADEMGDELDELKNRFKKVAVELGTAFAPALESLAKLAMSLAPIIEGLAKAFEGLGSGGQIAVIGLLAFISIVPSLVMAIGALKAGLDALSSNPVMLAVAAAIAGAAIIGTAALITSGINNSASQASSYSSSTYNNSNDNSSIVINVEGNMDPDELAEMLAEAKRSKGL